MYKLIKTGKGMKKFLAIVSIGLLAPFALAQKVSIPQNLTAKEMSPEISRSIKSALSDMAMPCGLEGAHVQHDHNKALRQALIQRESVLTTDSARKLIFSQEELNQHQLLTLIETLGELNAEDTDALLRSVYTYADALASRFLDVDIEDKNMAQLVYNSNITDIRSAVMSAVAKNKSTGMLDIVKSAAQGEGSVAQSANKILETRKLR